jgi:hypothetical protein
MQSTVLSASYATSHSYPTSTHCLLLLHTPVAKNKLAVDACHRRRSSGTVLQIRILPYTRHHGREEAGSSRRGALPAIRQPRDAHHPPSRALEDTEGPRWKEPAATNRLRRQLESTGLLAPAAHAIVLRAAYACADCSSPISRHRPAAECAAYPGHRQIHPPERKRTGEERNASPGRRWPKERLECDGAESHLAQPARSLRSERPKQTDDKWLRRKEPRWLNTAFETGGAEGNSAEATPRFAGPRDTRQGGAVPEGAAEEGQRRRQREPIPRVPSAVFPSACRAGPRGIHWPTPG